MKLHIKSIALGFVLASIIPIAIVAVFLWGVDYHTLVRVQPLASGKEIKILSFHLVWGIEHDDRNEANDSFALEYVLSNGDADESSLDQETLEVFELIRPISEQWGFKKASVAAFPKPERKGKYYIYNFARDPQGIWKFERQTSKVFIND